MISNFLKTWWKPLVFYLVIYIIYLIGLLYSNKFIVELFDWLIYFPIIIILISSIYILIKSKWYYSILQIGILGISMFI